MMRNRTLAFVNVTTSDPMQGMLLEKRYRIRGKIAQGGMASVYEAFDERLERLVAVKIMRPEYATDAVFASRFMREARSTAALNHPHIVAVFDQGHHDNTMFLVMEKVDGTTLRGVLKQRVRLNLAEAIGVIEPVLAALAQAHERGIAHRDVKPENVLISSTGIVKVADFGLARAVESTHQLTSRNTLLGTVAYLAPEQITNAESDARSDVYAVGIMLYEMLTGVKPHQGSSAMQVAYQHVNSDVPPPSDVVAQLPPQFDELVAAATRRDRTQRLASAGVFLTALRQTRLALGITPLLVRAADEVNGATEATPPDPRSRESASGLPPAASGQQESAEPQEEQSTAPRNDPGQSRKAPSTGTSVMPPLGQQQLGGSLTGMHRGTAAPEIYQPPEMPSEPPPLASSAEGARQEKDKKRRLLMTALAAAVVLVLLAGGLLWWLGGRNDVTVPQFIGLDKTAAESVAKKADIKVSYGTSKFSDSVSENVVLEQKPGAKQRVGSGDTITLVLSGGPRVRSVPQVRGKTRDEATKLLEAEHFTPVVSEEESQDIPKDSAIHTDPGEGRKLNVDSQIRLVISKGRGSTQVPDVVGLSRADAVALLAEHGLKATFTEETTDNDPNSNARIDSVLRQQTAPNSTVEKGSEVVLVISGGPAQVQVPNVRGLDCAQARELLRGAGLKANCQGASRGKVFFQSPNAGSTAERKSSVALFTFPI